MDRSQLDELNRMVLDACRAYHRAFGDVRNNQDEIDSVVEPYVEAIAQAAEEEMAGLQHTVNTLVGQLERFHDEVHELENLRAQVAVMAEALANWADVYERMYGIGEWAGKPLTAGTLHEHDAWRKTKAALAAAPKVAWHKVFTREQNWGDYSELDNAVDSALEDTNEVEVFVVECPRAHEQKQSTEQAQEGEQGYKPGTLLRSGYSRRQVYGILDGEQEA